MWSINSNVDLKGDVSVLWMPFDLHGPEKAKMISQRSIKLYGIR